MNEAIVVIPLVLRSASRRVANKQKPAVFLPSRLTIKVVLRKPSGSSGLSYHPGDHAGIMAENRSELVDAILSRLVNKPESDDKPVQLQLLQEKHTPLGKRIFFPLPHLTIYALMST